jgi:hypothetical protein
MAMPLQTPSLSFDEFMEQAWAEHDAQAEEVAQRVERRLQQITDPSEWTRLVQLWVHVTGEHLGHWEAGAALLQSLAVPPGQQRPTARGVATLRLGGGDDTAADGLDSEDAVAALALAASALQGRDELPRATSLFEQALERASLLRLDDSSPAVRALAIGGNNLAQALEERASRSAAETASMLRAAAAGLSFWRRCGGWLEHERAEYRMARSLLRAGQPAAGLQHAQACLAICEAQGASAFERFFGHVTAATCAQASGDDARFEEHHAQALRQWAEVPTEELAWCQDDLADLRRAAGDTHPGRCTCGQVRFRLSSAPLFVHACHCRWCQRESGSALAINAMIETSRLQVLAGQPDIVDTPSASGRGQRIARCPSCKVALWSHYSGAGPRAAFVRVGTLLDPDRLPPDIHIFTSTRQPWLELPQGVPAVPGYYDREQYWPATSLERRRALLAGTT